MNEYVRLALTDLRAAYDKLRAADALTARPLLSEIETLERRAEDVLSGRSSLASVVYPARQLIVRIEDAFEDPDS